MKKTNLLTLIYLLGTQLIAQEVPFPESQNQQSNPNEEVALRLTDSDFKHVNARLTNSTESPWLRYFSDSTLNFYFDQTGKLEIQSKTYTKKDSNQVIQTEFKLREGEWYKSKEKKFIFNDQYYPIEETEWRSSVYDSLILRPFRLVKRTYNQKNESTSNIYWNWNKTTKNWIWSSKWEYEFDPDGKRIKTHGFNWDEDKSEWRDYLIYDYSYDSVTGFPSSVIVHKNFNEEFWINNNVYVKYELLPLHKNHYQYDLQTGLKTKHFTDLWNKTNSTWEKFLGRDILYDSHGQRIESVLKSWKGGTWKPHQRDVNEYDDYGNLTSDATYFFNSKDSTWVGRKKMTFEFLERGENYLIIEAEYDWVEGQWRFWKKQEHYHSKIPWDTTSLSSSVPETSEKVLAMEYPNSRQVKIYPNPGFETIQIDRDFDTDALIDIQVFDVAGRAVIQLDKVENRSIDISSLNEGNYILRLRTKDRNYSQRFVKVNKHQ